MIHPPIGFVQQVVLHAYKALKHPHPQSDITNNWNISLQFHYLIGLLGLILTQS